MLDAGLRYKQFGNLNVSLDILLSGIYARPRARAFRRLEIDAGVLQAGRPGR